MVKLCMYSLACTIFLVGSCEAMDLKGSSSTSGDVWIIPDGHGGYTHEPVKVLKMYSWGPRFVEKEELGQLRSDSNPLDTLIDVVKDQPVVFGQNVEKYRFYTCGHMKNPKDRVYRDIRDLDGRIRVHVTFEPQAYSLEGINPSFITFSDIDETVAEQEKVKNILTIAAGFVAAKVAEHERETGTGPGAKLAARSAAIPTKYGIYYAAKSRLYDSRVQIDCLSQKTFDDLSPLF